MHVGIRGVEKRKKHVLIKTWLKNESHMYISYVCGFTWKQAYNCALLIIQLCEMFPNTVLCIDSTHGTYKFKLVTRIVPDDFGKGTCIQY